MVPPEQPPWINFTLFYTYNNPGSCRGIATRRSCQLYPATLNYPIQLQGNDLTFAGAIDNLTVVDIQPLSTDGGVDTATEYGNWTAGGLYIAACYAIYLPRRCTDGKEAWGLLWQ